MARVNKRVASRISGGLRKFQRILEAARARDVNESDTVVIITDFLSEVLGFQKYREITTEFAIRGTYCDLAVKTGGTISYLIEAKSIGSTLKERHLKQAINYSANQGIEWVVLTNGISWKVYRIYFEQPIRHELAVDLDLLEASARDKDVIGKLFLLSKEGLARSAIEEFQEERDACNPILLGAVVLSDPIVTHIRRELRRVTPGAKIDEDDVRRVLAEEVIKRDVLEGEEARQAGGRVRRAAGRSLRRRRGRVEKEEAKKLVGTPVSETPLPSARR